MSKVLMLWCALLMLGACSSSEAQTVYITRTGEKYHASDCRYLRQSKIAVTLKEAKERGYTACSVCDPVTDEEEKDKGNNEASKPPAAGSESPRKTTRETAEPRPVEKKSTTVTSSQCSATTKSGSRCKRSTTYANGRCWQHQ